MRSILFLPVRIPVGLAARVLGFLSLGCRDAAFDLERNTVGARHTEAGGIASNLAVAIRIPYRDDERQAKEALGCIRLTLRAWHV